MSLKDITPTELRKMLDEDSVCLVDVREDVEHNAFHIKNSNHIPLGQIDNNALPETNKPIVIYCLKGARGQKACEKVAGDCEQTVYNLTGGITAWKEAGFDVVESQDKMFPLDRQVQITIGSGVLLSVLASVFIQPYYVWIAAFFGAGLLFAGLSGTCGLAIVLAKMPWNKIKKA